MADEMIGKVFNRLKVVSQSGTRKNRRVWMCECACGKIVKVSTSALTTGNTQSCGCYRRDRNKESVTKHGKTKHALYKKWHHIKQRCTNPNDVAFVNYGKRGISFYSEWASEFKSFYEYSIMNGWEEGLEIDRIDNDGNYEPGNIRFTTKRVNTINRRLFKNNKSGFHGVYYRKDAKKWCASIQDKGKRMSVGRFKSKKLAALAYNIQALLYHGENAKWNNVLEVI